MKKLITRVELSEKSKETILPYDLAPIAVCIYSTRLTTMTSCRGRCPHGSLIDGATSLALGRIQHSILEVEGSTNGLYHIRERESLYDIPNSAIVRLESDDRHKGF